MNALHPDVTPARPLPPAFIRPALIAFCLGAGSLSALAVTEEAAVQGKAYALFMGANFDVQRGKEFHRVHDVTRSSFIVTIDDRKVSVPMDRGTVALKIRQELKLGEVAAVIQNLAKEPAYTPQNDPYKKFLRAQQGAAAQQMAAMAESQARVATDRANYAAMAASQSITPNMALVDQLASAAAVANQRVDSVAMSTRTDLYNVGYHAGRLGTEIEEGMFDAMKVSFVVSSPKPLTDPYLVIVAEYREQDDKPGVSRNWIYATELEPINDQPREVNIFQGGLPPGFILGNFHLHLYNGGEEVATTAAANRVPLDRPEAFDYLLLDYLGRHKGMTRPAQPVMGRLSAEARSRLTLPQLVHPCYVKVDKNGLPGAAYLDEACRVELTDPQLTEMVARCRFTPALEQGKPVASVVRLALGDLDTVME